MNYTPSMTLPYFNKNISYKTRRHFNFVLFGAKFTSVCAVHTNKGSVKPNERKVYSRQCDLPDFCNEPIIIISK